MCLSGALRSKAWTPAANANRLAASQMAWKYAHIQKESQLGLHFHLLGVPANRCFEHAGRKSSTPLTFAFSLFPCPLHLHHDGCRPWSSVVDHLEKQAVCQDLGTCRKPDQSPYFCWVNLPFSVSAQTLAGSGSRDCRSDRILASL